MIEARVEHVAAVRRQIHPHLHDALDVGRASGDVLGRRSLDLVGILARPEVAAAAGRVRYLTGGGHIAGHFGDLAAR